MKVILLRDVKGLGRMYEEKTVGDGYASNFLIPKKLAVPATGAAAANIKNLKENDTKHREAELKKLEAEVHKLASADINIKAKVNEKGHLFARLNKDRVSEILKERGINIPAEFIVLEQGIKDAGKYSIPVRIGEKETHFNLVIESQ